MADKVANLFLYSDIYVISMLLFIAITLISLRNLLLAYLAKFYYHVVSICGGFGFREETLQQIS